MMAATVIPIYNSFVCIFIIKSKFVQEAVSAVQLHSLLDKWDHWMCSVEHTATTVILFFVQAILRKNKEISSDASLR